MLLGPRLCSAQWLPQPSGTSLTLLGVRFVDSQNGYAVGQSGLVLKTSDGGDSWVDVSIATPYPATSVYLADPSTVWVATGDPNDSEVSGAVWHTTDGGSHWTQQTLTSTRARFGLAFANPSVGWACGAHNGTLEFQATTNGGSTWFTQGSSSLFGWTYGIDCTSTSQVWSVGVVFPSPRWGEGGHSALFSCLH